MEHRRGQLEEFFAALNVEAIIVRRMNADFIFVLKSSVAEHHRQYLQRWFVIVQEDEKYLVLKERLRGTDQTAH